jgi:hypothetical protein
VDPIVQGAELAADGLYNPGARTEKEITQLEELATQCCRALRNLSVNRTLPLSVSLSLSVSLPSL